MDKLIQRAHLPNRIVRRTTATVSNLISLKNKILNTELLRAHGIDISKFQKYFHKPGLTPYPIDFVIQRIRYKIWEDSLLNELYESMLEVSIRGGYIYFGSDFDWKRQADLMLESMEGKEYHFLGLDFERYWNVKSEKFAYDARSITYYLQEQSGLPVYFYTNPYTFNNWLKPYGWTPEEFPMWWAQWYYVASPFKDPTVPGSWKFWQYWADGNKQGKKYGVGSTDVDLDVYNGTVEELKTELNLAPKHPTWRQRVILLEEQMKHVYEQHEWSQE